MATDACTSDDTKIYISWLINSKDLFAFISMFYFLPRIAAPIVAWISQGILHFVSK